jgi:hypothetical protein
MSLDSELFAALHAAGDIVSIRGRFYVAIDTLPAGTAPTPTPPPAPPEQELTGDGSGEALPPFDGTSERESTKLETLDVRPARLGRRRVADGE